MALNQTFKLVRASLLHCVPLPTLESVVSELISEETRLGIAKPNHTDAVLTVRPLYSLRPKSSIRPSGSYRSSSNTGDFCRYCRQIGHLLEDCPKILNPVCSYCHQNGHLAKDCSKLSDSARRNKPTHPVAATTEQYTSIVTPTVATTDLASLLKQVLSNASNSFTDLSATSGTSWYFDSACCNHMTNNSMIFFSKISNSHIPSIQIADGYIVPVTYVGHLFTNNLSFPDTYFIPNLTLNLIFVGQLRELGFDILFFYLQLQCLGSSTWANSWDRPQTLKAD